MQKTNAKLKNGFYISLDFELFWGQTNHVVITEKQVVKYLKTLSVVNRTLELFQKYKIAATWATVGFLFSENKEEILSKYDYLVPEYKNENLSNYKRLSLTNKSHQDCYFALDLIKKIHQTPNQEIGTHTFSHYYCLEDGQLESTFEADLQKAIDIADEKCDITIKSIVFPRNQANYLSSLENYGLKTYRGSQQHWAYSAVSDTQSKHYHRRLYRFIDRYFPFTNHIYNINQINNENKITNVRQSRLLASYSHKLRYFEKIRIKRIKKEMTSAAQKGLSYHLWWHPHNFSNFTEKNFILLEEILLHFQTLKEEYNFQSLNQISSIP